MDAPHVPANAVSNYKMMLTFIFSNNIVFCDFVEAINIIVIL